MSKSKKEEILKAKFQQKNSVQEGAIQWNDPSSTYPSNSSSTNHYLSTCRSHCEGSSAWDSCDLPLLGFNTTLARIIILLLIY